jgi:uncharacterized membrane protein SirB2
VSGYLAIKTLHVACVVLSITGFAARLVLMLRKSALATRRWMRIAPHVNDTLLLAAAIALTVMTGQYPFVDAWLTAKVFGLIAYIVLASIALKAGRTRRARLAAGLAALLVFGYVASVALNKDARGILGLLAA